MEPTLAVVIAMNVLDGVCMRHRNNKISKNVNVVRLKFDLIEWLKNYP